MKYTSIIITLLISVFTYGQQNFSLDEIKLKDTILENTIKNFIVDTKAVNSEFISKGYVEVKLMYFNSESLNEDSMYKYSIKDQYYRPKGKNSPFPAYYFYIENKLVLVYDVWSQIYGKPKYKKRAKRKLAKLVKPYFDKPMHIKVRERLGKVVINDKDFVHESYNVHGGITLWVSTDGTSKITTYWDQFKKNKEKKEEE